MSKPAKFPAAAKYALGFLLGTALLITAAYLIENWRGDRAWAAEQRRLQEQGLPLSLDELIPPMPPDEENFAMAPIIAPALDITYLDQPNPAKRNFVRNQDLKWQRLQGLGDAILEADRNGNWQLGRTNDLPLMEQKYLERLKEVGGRAVAEDGTTNNLRSAFAGMEPELSAIEAALQRPHAQFPIAYEQHVSTLLPHLSILKKFSTLYSFRAELALPAGDSAFAFQDLITGLKVAETLNHEPIILSLMVHISMFHQTMHPMWEILRANALSEEQLRELQGQLSTIHLLPHASLALTGERLLLEGFINDFRNGRLSRVLELPDKFPVKLIPRGWLQRNKVHISRMYETHMRSLIDMAGHRYFPERAAAVDQAIQNEATFWFDQWLAGVLDPGSRYLGRAAVAQTHADLALVAVALERFQLAKGSYPESLQALSPEFLETVPHDLMTGEPLHYRRENGRFILYSVGLNQVDDGGIVVLKNVWSDGLDSDRGDLVWSYSHLVEKTEE